MDLPSQKKTQTICGSYLDWEEKEAQAHQLEWIDGLEGYIYAFINTHTYTRFPMYSFVVDIGETNGETSTSRRLPALEHGSKWKKINVRFVLEGHALCIIIIIISNSIQWYYF